MSEFGIAFGIALAVIIAVLFLIFVIVLGVTMIFVAMIHTVNFADRKGWLP